MLHLFLSFTHRETQNETIFIGTRNVPAFHTSSAYQEVRSWVNVTLESKSSEMQYYFASASREFTWNVHKCQCPGMTVAYAVQIRKERSIFETVTIDLTVTTSVHPKHKATKLLKQNSSQETNNCSDNQTIPHRSSNPHQTINRLSLIL